jgi:hypothetical protein
MAPRIEFAVLKLDLRNKPNAFGFLASHPLFASLFYMKYTFLREAANQPIKQLTTRDKV